MLEGSSGTHDMRTSSKDSRSFSTSYSSTRSAYSSGFIWRQCARSQIDPVSVGEQRDELEEAALAHRRVREEVACEALDVELEERERADARVDLGRQRVRGHEEQLREQIADGAFFFAGHRRVGVERAEHEIGDDEDAIADLHGPP
jgi:hypothetical protein